MKVINELLVALSLANSLSTNKDNMTSLCCRCMRDNKDKNNAHQAENDDDNSVRYHAQCVCVCVEIHREKLDNSPSRLLFSFKICV